MASSPATPSQKLGYQEIEEAVAPEGHSGSSQAGEGLQGSQAWPRWTEEEKKKEKQLRVLATLSVSGVIFPFIWLPDPSGLDAQDGVAHPLGVTFTCTKGWSPGAASRPAVGKRCHPGELGMGGALQSVGSLWRMSELRAP